MARENTFYENYQALLALKENSVANRILEKEKEEAKEAKSVREMVEYYRDRPHVLRENRYKFSEYVLNEMLSTAFKAVYMTALTENMILTNNGRIVAESLVDKYIKESGGASMVLENMKGKTYFLDTVRAIVEEAHEEVMDNADEEEQEEGDTPEVPEETKEKMFDKLEKEEDVDTAVNLIAQRISSAEEEFIKKNAEDKQKIEELINGINERIQATKSDPNLSDEQVEKIEQESAIESKRKISNLRDERPHTVFEMMVRKLSSSVIKEDALHNDYTTENGQIDMESVVEATKCLYGFLEFVNTTQLEKVDEAYVKKVIKEL